MMTTIETMVMSYSGINDDDYDEIMVNMMMMMMMDDDDDGDDDDRIVSLDSDGKNGQHRGVGDGQLCN